MVNVLHQAGRWNFFAALILQYIYNGGAFDSRVDHSMDHAPIDAPVGSGSFDDLFLLQHSMERRSSKLEPAGPRAALHREPWKFDDSVNMVPLRDQIVWLIPTALCAFELIAACFWARALATHQPSAAQEMLDQVHPNALPGSSARSSSEGRTPQDVIDDLGFGPAQLWVLMLAEGPMLLYVMEAVVLGTGVTSMATDLGLSAYERGLLQTALTAGRIPGLCLGGWFGDRDGRRPARVMSIMFMTMSALGISVAPDFISLCVCRAAYGCAVGFGQPSAISMVIEVTPKRWRMVTFILQSLISSCGSVLAHLLCWAVDPTLETLDWRLCTKLTIPPLLVFFILASLFLDESPLFLAARGNHTEAQLAFARIRQVNACPEVSISYTDSLPSAEFGNNPIKQSSFWTPLRAMFSYGVLGCSVTLIILEVTEKFFHVAEQYGLARVFIVEADKHELTAGIQTLITSWMGIFALLVPLALDGCLARKRLLLLSQMIAAVSCSVFAWSAHTDQHSWMVEVILQLSLAADRITIKTIGILLGLAVVESYPTTMRSTAVAVISNVSNIATLIGPLVFEWFDQQFGLVTAFFYAMSGLAIFNIFCISALMPDDMESMHAIVTERLKAISSESEI